MFKEEKKDELIAMGASKEKINKTREELLHYYILSDSNLAEELKINKVEAAMFKKAIEAGLKSSSKIKDNKNGVSASGSIASSKMEYKQTVKDNSTSSAPSYDVKLSYEWKEVYTLAVLDDKIVAVWGGGLNTKNISSSAKYYNWSNGSSFGSKYTTKEMTKTKDGYGYDTTKQADDIIGY